MREGVGAVGRMRRRESDPASWLCVAQSEARGMQEDGARGCREGRGKGMQGRRGHGHGARAHVWNGVGIVRLP